MTGCAAGQEAVAGFVTALKDIDGVTRVGRRILGALRARKRAPVRQAAVWRRRWIGLPAPASSSPSFSIVVAFDAAPVPVSAEAEAAAVPPKRPNRLNRPRPKARKAAEMKLNAQTRTA